MDGEANEYRCPEGHALRSERRMFKIERNHVTKAGTVIYRASKTDCSKCSMKPQCCPNTPMRKIARSIHEDARDVARRIHACSRRSEPTSSCDAYLSGATGSGHRCAQFS